MTWLLTLVLLINGQPVLMQMAEFPKQTACEERKQFAEDVGEIAVSPTESIPILAAICTTSI